MSCNKPLLTLVIYRRSFEDESSVFEIRHFDTIEHAAEYSRDQFWSEYYDAETCRFSYPAPELCLLVNGARAPSDLNDEFISKYMELMNAKVGESIRVYRETQVKALELANAKIERQQKAMLAELLAKYPMEKGANP